MDFIHNQKYGTRWEKSLVLNCYDKTMLLP